METTATPASPRLATRSKQATRSTPEPTHLVNDQKRETKNKKQKRNAWATPTAHPMEAKSRLGGGGQIRLSPRPGLLLSQGAPGSTFFTPAHSGPRREACRGNVEVGRAAHAFCIATCNDQASRIVEPEEPKPRLACIDSQTILKGGRYSIDTNNDQIIGHTHATSTQHAAAFVVVCRAVWATLAAGRN